MSEHPHPLRRALLASTLGLALPAAAFAQCPPAATVGKQLQDLFKRPIEVKKVSPAAAKGLCEIQVSVQGQPNVLYADAKGDHFIVGPLIEIASGRNLTEETISSLKKIPAGDMEKLDALVAMTVGSKGPTVYFVTDPQ